MVSVRKVPRCDVLHPVAVTPLYTVPREEVAPEVPREEVARRDVLHPVAVTPLYTVPREEVAPEVPREEVAPEVPRVNQNRINRWTRNAAMRDYLSGKEIEC